MIVSPLPLLKVVQVNFFFLQKTVVWHKSNKIDGTVSIVLFGVVALFRTGIIKCVEMRIEMSTTEFKVADRSPKR